MPEEWDTNRKQRVSNVIIREQNSHTLGDETVSILAQALFELSPPPSDEQGSLKYISTPMIVHVLAKTPYGLGLLTSIQIGDCSCASNVSAQQLLFMASPRPQMNFGTCDLAVSAKRG
jgi:hypothetical protein